ncbi:cysteine and histidine-rich domain-containing protein [Sporobolomyces salmoneus]|uniref:cysteine and histidine-rich domain-containing protein n=1 Tax=Sporobolomyces salmoneus TaxID=183962 RepID=UPI00317550AD
MATVKCTRNGCGKQFNPAENDGAVCSFHPGHPVFHEGLKSWSCCASTNKPTTDFDDFMKFEPCATGSHSSEKPEPVAKPEDSASTSSKAPSSTSGTTETYGTAAPPLPPPPSAPSASTSTSAPPKPVSTAYVEEQDDPDVKLEKGMTCKRKSCGKSYGGEGMERSEEECRYHPGVPIFHEGSKGFSCCKRRVLEFDEFLRIEGCKTGKHLFVGAKKSDSDQAVEEQVECRIDHYQTPRQVIVSVFGKNADKEKSSVKFENESMTIDLILPSNKRFTRTLTLYGPIDPSTSTYKIFGTKCEITLSKADSRSWPTVTALDPALSSNFVAQLAFSAGGGRGTTGAKEAVLDETNKGRA